jgi:exonuclease VII large subunit
MKKVLMLILSVGTILGVGGYFLVKESYAATPADPLFAVQGIADDVQRAFTFDEVAKTELEQEILVRRQEQVEKMTEREEVTDEQLEEALQLMVQQRTRVQEKLQTVEQKLEQNQVNEKATEAIQNVQKQYDVHLDKQLETIDKAQERGNGIGQSVKEDTVEEAIERGRSIPQNVESEVEEEGGENVEQNIVDEERGNAPDDVGAPETSGR